MKHRIAILDEVKARIPDVSNNSKCTGSITLSATGAAAEEWPEYLGTYLATEETEEGAPVYRNSDGKYLFRKYNGTWHADYAICDDGIIKSVDTLDTAECPASIRQWQYGVAGIWRSGDITATCSVHILGANAGC